MKKLIPLFLALMTAVFAQQGQLASSYTASGTAGAGYLQLANQSSAPATPTSAGRLYFDTSNLFAWKNAGGFIGKIDLGGAARTITLSGNPTLADWFDQAVKSTSSPTFSGVSTGTLSATGTFTQTVVGNAIHILNANNSGSDSYTSWQLSSVGKLQIGSPGTAGNIVASSVVGDGVFRLPSGSFRFTADAGVTNHAVISSTGLAVTGTLSTTGNVSFVGTGSNGSGALRMTANLSSQSMIDLGDSADASGAGFLQFRNAAGTGIGSVARVTTTNAVAYNTTSDARLKENFRDFTNSGRLIDALRPRVFDWKGATSNDGKNVIGFIAQEENAADPVFAHIGAVTVGDDDPETITRQWQRSDSALIPILVAEIKALRARVQAIENKINPPSP